MEKNIIFSFQMRTDYGIKIAPLKANYFGFRKKKLFS